MAKGSRDENLLDNPVWHSLHGPLSGFVAPSSTADPNAGMKRDLIQFDPSVNIFSAVDEIDDTKWNRIAELVGVEGFCALFRDVIPASPAGWEEHFRGTCLQMVAEDLPGSSGLAVVRLGTGDAAGMLALTELTEPGPFMSRTVELGRYVGIRRDGRLIAMAGSLNMRGQVSFQLPYLRRSSRARWRKWIAKSTLNPSVMEERMATGMS